MKASSFLLIAVIIYTTASFNLQGNWTLVAIDNKSVTIPAAIDQYVFRTSLIMNRLFIATCNSLTYQVSIESNAFWVNIDSQLIDTTVNCSENDINMTQRIRQTIRSVLTFGIIGDQLYLYDPSEGPMMVFNRTRINGKRQYSISGSWILTLSQQQKSAEKITFDEQKINACNGAVYKYSVNPPYTMGLTLESGVCSNTKLADALQKIQYFRRIDEKIVFYDSNVKAIGEASPNSEIVNTNKSSIITNLPNSTPVPIDNAQLKPSDSSPRLATGNYILLLLFRRDLMRVRVQIRAQQIQLTLCSRLIFGYSLSSQQSISITSNSTPNQRCARGDQSIYFNFIISATSYKVDPDGLVTFIDNSNKSIISLVPQ